MDQMPTSSHRNLLIGLGAVVLLIFVIAGVTFLLFGSMRRDNGAMNDVSKTKVVTKETIEQNLGDSKASIKQAISDQSAAKSALKDSNKQIKVSN